tara:strand:- start:8139 stop:8327 length:189 start_codon:yes stop_codon:yes gene_type:complete
MNPRLKRYTTGTGKGYPLTEEIKKEIYQMYSRGMGMRAIGHKLGISWTTVQRHVKRMQEEQV